MKRLIVYGFLLFTMTFFSPGCSPTESAILSIDRSQCIGCAKCINVCKADAIRIISNKAVIDPSKCIKCGNCVEICPVDAVY